MKDLDYEDGRGISYADFVITYGNLDLIWNQSLRGPSGDRYRFIT